MAEYYAIKVNGKGGEMVEMRQTRFKEQYQAGNIHPNDICAHARSVEELKSMVEQFGFDVDYSGVEQA